MILYPSVDISDLKAKLLATKEFATLDRDNNGIEIELRQNRE